MTWSCGSIVITQIARYPKFKYNRLPLSCGFCKFVTFTFGSFTNIYIDLWNLQYTL